MSSPFLGHWHDFVGIGNANQFNCLVRLLIRGGFSCFLLVF